MYYRSLNLHSHLPRSCFSHDIESLKDILRLYAVEVDLVIDAVINRIIYCFTLHASVPFTGSLTRP